MARNVGLNSTFDYQRQVINELAVDVEFLDTNFGQITTDINDLKSSSFSVGENGVYIESNVGIGTSSITSNLTVEGDAIFSGIVTSFGGFSSELTSNPVKITVSGGSVIFDVVGIGSTSFALV
jgi:hypothetical protein